MDYSLLRVLSRKYPVFWISPEPVAWPWRNSATSQRRPYCASVNSHSPVGLVNRQWEAVDWACVLCDRRIHNDRASISAKLHQCACPFYSSRADSFGKASHHPDMSAPLQPRFCSLRLLVFPKGKFAIESTSRKHVAGKHRIWWWMRSGCDIFAVDREEIASPSLESRLVHYVVQLVV